MPITTFFVASIRRAGDLYDFDAELFYTRAEAEKWILSNRHVHDGRGWESIQEFASKQEAEEEVDYRLRR